MRVLLFATAVACALAQAPARELRIGSGRILNATSLRARPNINSPGIAPLAAGASVRTLGGAAKAAFLRVAGDRGPAGWVPEADVEILNAPQPVGCPQPSDTNRKKSSSTREAAILDANDLIRLQREAERISGMGRDISADERLQLSDLPSGEIRIGDGSVARIGGFVAAKPDPPRMAGNCSSGAPDDWIFNLTSDANASAFTGIVCRVSATKRNGKWSLEKLQTVWKKQLPVLVTGTLYYDSAAFVDDDSLNPIPAQLPRSWLWELRQVSSILVCTGGGACEPGSAKGWSTLSEMD